MTNGRQAVEAVLLRDLTGDEAKHVDYWLGRAHDAIVRELGRVPDRATEWELSEAVQEVQARLVARLFRGANGIVSESDGQYNYRLAPGSYSNSIRLTDEDRETLGINTSGGLWVINPSYGKGYR